ncbi:MAG: PDZ domain-containing protein, partial [Planctomycetia bacterium]|nr:PDZ domain-containing protein [Planctomycetia bacterium]
MAGADTLEPAGGEHARPRDRAAGEEGYLGIVTGIVSDELRAQLELPDDCGLVVRQVVPASPAEKAGLVANDVLLTFGGRKVTSPLEFAEMVQGTTGGAKVRLDIVRRGKRQHVVAVVEAREPRAAADVARAPRPLAAGQPGQPGQPG